MTHQYVWVLLLIGIAFLIRLIDEAPTALRSWALRALSGDETQPIDDEDYEGLARTIVKQIRWDKDTRELQEEE